MAAGNAIPGHRAEAGIGSAPKGSAQPAEAAASAAKAPAVASEPPRPSGDLQPRTEARAPVAAAVATGSLQRPRPAVVAVVAVAAVAAAAAVEAAAARLGSEAHRS